MSPDDVGVGEGPAPDQDPLVPTSAPVPQDLLDETEPPFVVGRPPLRGWSVLVLVVGALGAAALVAAGLLFSHKGLGGAGAARGCRPGLGAGLVLILIGGVLAGVARTVADMRTWHETWFDWSRVVVACLGPAVVLALASPATMGCRTGLRMGNMPLVGDALTGAPSVALAAAAAALVGSGLASIVRVRIPAPVVAEAWQAELDAANAPLDEMDQVLERHDLLD